MRKILVIIIALPPLLLGAEWQSLNGPPAGRADDMTIGWDSEYNCWAIFAADNTHKLYKSTDLINPLGEYWDSIYLDPNVVNPACVISRPNDAQIVYIGKNSTTPVWWSEDGGQTWEERSGESPNNITNTSPLCFAMDPNAVNTIYLGCDRITGQPDMFKTTNGGDDWTEPGNLPNVAVNDIAIYGTIILAGCSKGLKSDKGIWLSTNGGAHWDNTLDSVDVISIEFANNTIVYAGTHGDGIFKSTDGGYNWTKLKNSPQTSWVRGLKAITPDSVYAAIEDIGMFLTTDGGISWNPRLESGLYAISFRSRMISKPSDYDIIFAGSEFSVYKSSDRGVNWQEKANGYKLMKTSACSSVNSHLYVAGYSPTNERKWLLVSITPDGGDNWHATRQGITGCDDFGAIYYLDVHRFDTNIVCVGTENGTLSNKMATGGIIWQTTNGGYDWSNSYTAGTIASRLNCIVFNSSSEMNNYVYAGFDCFTFPGSVQLGFMRNSQYGGSEYWEPCTSGLGTDTVFSIAVNPQNGSIIYAGTASLGVYRSSCNGDTWNQTNLTDVDVKALAIDFDYPDVIYAGSKNPNGIYKTINAGSVWFQANNGLGSHRYIQDIEIDSEEPTIVYTLCKQNKNADQSYVYCSVDRGSQWFDISTGLPTDKKIHDLEIDYDEPDTVFVATENGIYTYTPDFDKSRVSSSEEATSYNNGRKMVRIDSTIWVCYESGGAIYATKSTDLGQTWSKKMELGTGEIPAIACPKDAALWHPEVGVAWISHGASKDTIYYRQYSSSNWENPDTVYTTDGTPKALSLALNNNQVFVIFTETPEAPNGEFVVCARFIPGQTVTADTLDSGPGAFYASIDYLKDNATVNAAWAKNNQIYFTYYDGDWDQSIEQVGFSDSTNTQVSIEAKNGRAYVVWSAKAPSGSHYNVYWRYKSYNGTPSWSSTYLVSRNSTSDCEYPTLTEGICCSYTQNNEIYFNSFDSMAGNWGSAPVNISNTDQRSIYSHITHHQINDETYIYYIWTEKDSIPYDIKFSSYKIPFPASPDIMVNKQSDNAVIAWHPVTTDIYGNPITCDGYTTYRDTSFDFVASTDNLIASGSDTAVIDTNALLASDNYNYLTFSHSTYGTQSTKSNMGYVFHKFLNENHSGTPDTMSDRNWVSLPYISEYDSVKDITDDLSPSGDPISKITRLDATTQNYYSWIYNPGQGWWYGNDPSYPNFPIVLGTAYEMIAIADDTVIFVGANEADSSVFLNVNPGDTTDKNWISLPYNAAYDSVKDITTELAPTGSAISKITRLDETTQNLYSWIYHFVLGWYGNDPGYPGQNFPIEPGTGYEFVAEKDTTWNPTEWSNEEEGLFIVVPPTQKSDVNMCVGTSLQPTREPTWYLNREVEKQLKGNMHYRCADSYRPMGMTSQGVVDLKEDNIGVSASKIYKSQGPGGPRGNGEDERRISHIVWTHFDATGFENIVFATYRLNDPYDVLTEKSVSCVTANNGSSYNLISFDVGNFKKPWKDEEEVVLIVEATLKGKAYYDIIDYKLDEGVDIQELREIELKPYSTLLSGENRVYWNATHSDRLVGYSLYQNGKRLNEKVLTMSGYSIEADVDLKLVIIGGHETVYGSQGIQSSLKESEPISYTFNIKPNPFVKQTRLDYALPNQASVEIIIYDVAGRKVKGLVSEIQNPGYYSTVWNGSDDMARRLASGVYFIRFETGEFRAQDKVLMVK